MRGLTLLAALFVAALVGACGEDERPAAKPDGVRGKRDGVRVMAVGDLGACARGTPAGAGECEATGVARLVANARPAAFLVPGDLCYDVATAACYEQSYDPAFGRLKNRTLPALGNHEYAGDVSAYFDYFGARAGDPDTGYYSRNVGSWHVVALNSNCEAVGGCGFGSRQERWLRRDLAADDSRCTLAFWHHARFSSGLHRGHLEVTPFWVALMEDRAELVVSAHDHLYERFAVMDAEGAEVPDGLRSFVVGSGGRSHYPIADVLPGSRVRINDVYGALELILRRNGYSWRFLSVDGAVMDRGQGRCR